MYSKKPNNNRTKPKFYKKTSKFYPPSSADYAKQEDNFEEPILVKGGKAFHRAIQMRDKYLDLAREVQASGDRVAAENYYQHADHYNRLIITASSPYPERKYSGRPPYRGSSYQADQEIDAQNKQEKNPASQEEQSESSVSEPASSPYPERRYGGRPSYRRSSSHNEPRDGNRPTRPRRSTYPTEENSASLSPEAPSE